MKRFALGIFPLVLACAPQDDAPGPDVNAEANYRHDLNNVPVSFGVGTEIRPIESASVDTSLMTYFYSVSCVDFLGCETVKSEVSQALRAWEKMAGLVFVEAHSNTAQIRISFEGADHETDCDTGFSSAGGTLAHAFTEGCAAGEIHLNRDLQWSLVGTRHSAARGIRYDLRTVVIHEVGHLLGLLHTEDEISVMHSAYNGSKRRVPDTELRKARNAILGDSDD